MKNSVKLFIVLAITCMIGIKSVFAVTTDVNGPTLSYLTFASEDNSFKPGDKVYLNTDMADDVSGIRGAVLSTYKIGVSDESYYPTSDRYYQALSVGFERTRPFIIIPDTYVAGRYFVSSIDLYDNQDNRTHYYTKDQIQYYEEMYEYNKDHYLFENFDAYLSNLTKDGSKILNNVSVVFTVSSDSDDTSAPILESFEISSQRINFSDTVYFNIKVRDESLVHASIGLSNGTSIGFNINDNRVVTSSYQPKIGTQITLGKVYVSNIILEDIYGNLTFYLMKDYSGTLSVDYYKKKASIIEETDEDWYFEIIDDGSIYLNDDTKPVLDKVVLKNSILSVPAYLQMELYAHDDGELAPTASVTFTSGEKKLSATLYLDEDGVYRGELDINQYAELGYYNLADVYLSDLAENHMYYSSYNTKYRDSDLASVIELVSFKVISKFTPDITTSSIASDLIEKIQNAADDAIIAIDATSDPIIKKELFEAIKGTNKVVHIESNSIEWVFEGKDIVEPKDIDVSLSVYNDYNYYDIQELEFAKKLLVLKFADNGELPGIATIRLKLDYQLRKYVGDTVFIYYFDQESGTNKTLTDILADPVTLNENGWFEFKISHNSVYLLSAEKVDEKYVKHETTGNSSVTGPIINNSNSSKTLLYAVPAIIVIAAIAIVIIKNKSNRKKDSTK